MYSTTTFLGVALQQDPLDAFAIADLLWRLRPRLLIELGTSGGGGALFYARVMSAYDADAQVLASPSHSACSTLLFEFSFALDSLMNACTLRAAGADDRPDGPQGDALRTEAAHELEPQADYGLLPALRRR